MSNERDELSELTLQLHITLAPKVLIPEARKIAASLLAAGCRRPRTITTVEELDALTAGSAVLTRDGRSVGKYYPDGTWYTIAGDVPMNEHEMLPATVLHEHEAALEGGA